MAKFIVKLMLISVISFISGWLLGYMLLSAIYMLGSLIAVLNIEENGGLENEN